MIWAAKVVYESKTTATARESLLLTLTSRRAIYMSQTPQHQPPQATFVQLYMAERSSNTGTVNVLIALVALSLTYYVATISYVLSSPTILEGITWVAFLLPLIPAAMFSWLLMFAILEKLRRTYLLHLERQMWPGNSAHRNLGFVRIEAALWTPGFNSVWRALTTMLSFVLYGVLYVSYASYLVIVGIFVAKKLSLASTLWMTPYILHLLGGMTVFIYSVARPRRFIETLRASKVASRWA